MSKLGSKIFNKLKHFYEHIYIKFTIVIFAIFLLFSGDLEIIYLPLHAPFSQFRKFLLIFFSIEFLSSNFFEKNYFFSYFFFLDFIDLFSLATEVTWTWDPIYEYLDSQSIKSNEVIKYVVENSSLKMTGMAIDADSTKLLSILKVIAYLKVFRVAKVIELYKKIRSTHDKNNKQKKSTN